MLNKSRIEKDKLAEKGVLYEKYFEHIKTFLRFKRDDYYDMQKGISEATKIYHKKLLQLNSIIWLLNLLYSENIYYDLKTREYFGYQIELIDRRCKDYLEYLLKDFTKE